MSAEGRAVTQNIRTLTVPSADVRVDVAFYDEAEEKKLLAYPTAGKMLEVVQNGVSIPPAEFLTYYLFKRKRPGKAGYRSYAELGSKVERAISDLEDWVEFRDDTLLSAPDVDRHDSNTTERIGEGIALSVVNRIHELHEADWDKIPEHPGPKGFPTFDYQVASDGHYIVQVEAKGTFVDLTSEKGGSVATQAKKARDKKREVRELQLDNQYRYPADLRYGAVCAFGKNGRARCWLLDPPADGGDSALRVRLLNRMRFIADLVTFISPRSQLASSLATRMRALESLADPFELAKVPLIRGNGEPVRIAPFQFGQHGFFRYMSHVVDGPAGGVVFQMPSGDMFLIGIREDLAAMAADQDFDRLLKYDFGAHSMVKEVRCVISKGRATNMDLPEGVDLDTSRSYVRFVLNGVLHYARSGLVFGVLPVDREPKEEVVQQRAKTGPGAR